MRDVEIPNWLKELPSAPVFHPTDTEFADPIAYISKIEKEASVFGICKVIPPLPKPTKRYVVANLNKSLLKCPELGNDVKLNNLGKADGDVRAVFTTRHQELGHNTGKRTKEVNKQVWQSGEIYTLDQFELKSKTFARSQLGTVKETSPLTVESLFWKASCEKPIYIEYANDVPGSGFGEPVEPSRFVHKHGRRRTFRRNDKDHYKTNNCEDPKDESVRCSSPSSSVDVLKKDVNSPNVLADRVPRQRGSSSNGDHELEGSSGWKLSNCPWNLQVIARSPGSLTRFMPDDIPGVTSPMVYIGMLFSWFAWHVEDHELHSLNFLHMGSPKTWYAVPGDYASTFEEVIRSKAYGGGVDRLAALTLLGEKTTLLSPETVVASGIPCCRLVQNPGEFVVTFPRAYHIGFSHGFNCGEAANFGTPKWLSVAKEAAVRRAAMNFLPMLSHQHLLYLLTMSFIPRVPRSLLPGIRSSRLKNRQKEERELLVKKEFLKDILKENKLLTSILIKNNSYRAVLWDPDSLSPSIAKEPNCSNITTDNTRKDDAENDNNLDDFLHMSQEMETLLHMEEDDMSSDFQIDSGTLPCVACGVLGYPFMSILQPSSNVFLDENHNINHIIPLKNPNIVQDLGIQNSSNSMDEDSVSGGLDPSLSKDSSEVNIGNRWNMSNGYLRPRIFCLEHASKIEELLVSKGGAKLLIICHSDFQKIRTQAATIAEEIGSVFVYNDIQLDKATHEDLDLINLAIDNEQEDESLEDWTLRLNINLRHSVKLKDKLSPGKINHALTLDGLFSNITSTSSSLLLQWQATKTRSNRKLNPSVKDLPKEMVFDGQMVRKKPILIQYSRRNFKLKSKEKDLAMDLGKNLSEKVSLVLINKEKVVGENSVGSVSCATSIENSGVEKDGGNGQKTDVENDTSYVDIGNDENTPGSSCFDSRNESRGVDEPFTDLEIGDDGNTPGSNCFASRNGSKRADEPVEGLDIGSDENTPGPSNASRKGSKSSDEPVTDLNRENDEDIPGPNCVTSRNGNKRTDELVTDSNIIKDKNTPCSSSRNGSKRKREVDLLDFNGFIRSPCEGLRPRSQKSSHKDPPSMTTPEKPTKKTKSSLKTREKDENGPHKCDLEGCKLSFHTKTELNLHKKNRCPHEGCGKKFTKHSYAVKHLRVHNDDRPLKCSWKGCKMTFKWAWARTEHLRVHTGEKPYKCKVCDRAFRFVSDFSRHKRKTGHMVHLKE